VFYCLSVCYRFYLLILTHHKLAHLIINSKSNIQQSAARAKELEDVYTVHFTMKMLP